MKCKEAHARTTSFFFFPLLTIQELDKRENSCAGYRHYLSGCSASSSAWSQELGTTVWPRTRSSHHPCAGPARNPGSANTQQQPLQGNDANYPAQTTGNHSTRDSTGGRAAKTDYETKFHNLWKDTRLEQRRTRLSELCLRILSPKQVNTN